MRVSDFDHDPTRDPQLADAWSAFTHLVAATETPVDVDQITARVVAQVERRARRRRWQIGATALAAAASLLLVVGLFALRHGGEPRENAHELATSVPPAIAPEPSAPASEPTDHMVAKQAIPDRPSSTSENINQTFTIEPWEDELATETASLAEQVQSVEQGWHERPDSIALLQTQIEQFEQDMASGEL